MEAAATQLLNNLLVLNVDRIKEYKRASKEASDVYWSTVFVNTVEESQKFAEELTSTILRLGGSPRSNLADSTRNVFSLWITIHSAFVGRNHEAILNECKCVEDGIQKAYVNALQNKVCSPELRVLIERQLELLQTSCDRINGYGERSFS